MTTESERIADKTAVSSRIGETVRFIGFGLVAVFYTIQTNNEPSQQQPDLNWMYIIVGFFGVITILFDYFQYLSGYFSAKAAAKRSDSNFAYNRKWLSYQLREFFFWAKQVSAAIGSFALVSAMLLGALQS